jgi:hypothetical protein
MERPPLGRPRLREFDDLKVLKERKWKELVVDRKVWSDLFEKAKTPKGLWY